MDLCADLCILALFFCRYFKLKKCVSRTSSVKGEYGVGIVPKWPERLTKAPSRAKLMKNGMDVFDADTRRWARRVAYYKNSLELKLGTPAIRNVMDMNAFFGGFAAALLSDPVWVMNVVPARKRSTLGIIYDRGLTGVYHDWWVLMACSMLTCPEYKPWKRVTWIVYISFNAVSIVAYWRFLWTVCVLGCRGGGGHWSRHRLMFGCICLIV